MIRGDRRRPDHWLEVGGGSIVDCVELLADRQPDALAQIFISADGGTTERTYRVVSERARAIAVALRDRVPVGGRALLLHPPGPEAVEAFLGCLYAGVHAVPAYPPDPFRLERTVPRLMAIVDDAEPAVVLTTEFIESVADALVEHAPGLGQLTWLATDSVPSGEAAAWTDPGIAGNDIAFIQYSSGSTRTPRGVVLTHGNLLANAQMIFDAFELTVGIDRGVSWLPTYHDMGLIGGVLQPLLSGGDTILLSPLDFLKSPIRWLQALSDFRGTISGGPDFAYDLCVRKTTPEQRAALDLSAWSLAFTGAEPVRPTTMARFAEAFAVAGFSPDAFYPCYGLAEATLIVTGKRRREPPRTLALDSEALERHDARPATSGDAGSARSLVSCGPAVAGVSVRVVDPATGTPLAEAAVGEIQVAGPSVAGGYWNGVGDEAFLAEADGTRWLATGDLGFLDGEELVVTGRIKEMLILHGRNLYAQDIEACARDAHPVLGSGNAAAFMVDSNSAGPGLVVCQEVDGVEPDALDAVAAAAARAVTAEFGVEPSAVALVAPRSIPKTSSGKVQRIACAAAWDRGAIEVLARWVAPT